MTATCTSHPFKSDRGATCTLPAGHDGGRVYESAWLADRHTQEVNDE